MVPPPPPLKTTTTRKMTSRATGWQFKGVNDGLSPIESTKVLGVLRAGLAVNTAGFRERAKIGRFVQRRRIATVVVVASAAAADEEGDAALLVLSNIPGAIAAAHLPSRTRAIPGSPTATLRCTRNRLATFNATFTRCNFHQPNFASFCLRRLRLALRSPFQDLLLPDPAANERTRNVPSFALSAPPPPQRSFAPPFGGAGEKLISDKRAAGGGGSGTYTVVSLISCLPSLCKSCWGWRKLSCVFFFSCSFK